MLDLTSESYARDRIYESPLRILREAGGIVITEPSNQIEKEEFFKALSKES